MSSAPSGMRPARASGTRRIAVLQPALVRKPKTMKSRPPSARPMTYCAETRTAAQVRSRATA